MRLSQKEIEFIKKTIKKYFKDAKIYLFGSILNDEIKGGDVDIYIITTQSVDFEKKALLKFELQNFLYRPVDLVFHKDFNLEIEKEARKGIAIH